jgi:hypothetical protein
MRQPLRGPDALPLGARLRRATLAPVLAMTLFRIALLASAWLALAGPAAAHAAGDVAQAPSLAVAGAAPPGAPSQAEIPRGVFGRRGIEAIKASVAFAATALLSIGWLLERRGRGAGSRRLRDGLLAVLGLIGLLCWWNLFQFHYPGFTHPSETYHYYLGAKYLPELGYTRLYACTAVADAEAGLTGPALERPMRNLETNRLETTQAILAAPERCKEHFTPARWAAFTRDVGFLRSRVNLRRWKRFQQDHGYNATPAWSVLPRALTSAGWGPAVELRLLQQADTVLLALMWAAVVVAFGWRIAAVAAIYWGTNYAAPFDWTGGSILRQDWLAASVVGVCLLRRGRPTGAGFLLTVAALLRIFPGLIVVGVALGAMGTWVVQRRLAVAAAQGRFVAGCALALAVVLPLAAWSAGGFGAWRDFAANSRVHLATPLANHGGLATVLAYDHEQRTELARDMTLDDPMQRWKQARRDQFAAHRALFVALVLGFALLVARAGVGKPMWLAAVLGVALIPIATELTAYYWSVLLILAFPMERTPVQGPALCGLATVGWLIPGVWHWTDQIHVWLSVATVAFCVFTVLLATRADTAPPAAERSPG